MNRRHFVTTAGLAGVAPALTTSAGKISQKDSHQYFELRHYHLATRHSSHKQRLADYLKDAAIPAWNRHGIKHIGVFSVIFGPNSPSLYVLLPHPNLESVSTLRSRLQSDDAYQKAGAPFLHSELVDPAFLLMESSLMKGFDGMPHIAVPPGAATNQARIF